MLVDELICKHCYLCDRYSEVCEWNEATIERGDNLHTFPNDTYVPVHTRTHTCPVQVLSAARSAASCAAVPMATIRCARIRSTRRSQTLPKENLPMSLSITVRAGVIGRIVSDIFRPIVASRYRALEVSVSAHMSHKCLFSARRRRNGQLGAVVDRHPYVFT